MKKKTSFIKFIQLWGIIFLFTVGGSIIVLDVIVSHRDSHVQAEKIRADYILRQKEMVKDEVDRVVAQINYEKAQSEEVTKEKIKSRVYEAYAVAQHIYQQNKTAKSKDEIKQMILDALRPIRFAKDHGYYFATRLDGVEMLFADKPEMEGLNLLDMQDTHGQYVIKDIIEITKQSGEGFYEYYWTKPGAEGNDFKKISFVKRFEPLNWVIGTGLYVGDVKAQIKTELLSTISRVRFGKEGYIFVNRLNGDALVSNGKCFGGTKKLWQVFNENPEKQKDVFKKEYNAALKPEGDYIYYSWIKLSDPSQEAPKTSFIYGLPELQWLVGAGVYLDDVETDIAEMYTELNKRIEKKILFFALIVIGVVVFFLFFFNFLSRRLKNDFNLFSSFFNRAAHSDEAINRDLVQFVELDQMAVSANKMLQDKVLVQQDLLGEKEALRESEKKYRDMVNLLPQVIFEADIQGNFTFVNQQAYNIFGYSKDDFDKGFNIIQIFIAEDIGRAKENIMNVLGGERLENVGYTATRKDGTTFPIITYTTPIIKEGKPVGLRGIVIDISEHKRLEDELLKRRKLEAVGVLAGGIAHDFNNILAAILGNISLALTLTDPQDKTYDLLVSSEKASLRAKDLTQQLLTFAKGGEPIKKIAVIDEVIRDSADFVLRGSNVRCKFSFGENLWPVVIDPGQISQVIQNVVINAAQAMPTGGVIDIDCRNYCRDLSDIIPVRPGNYIKITIKDKGLGIPKELLESIFDPYFTTKQRGSGLGLAITHSIISKHDGYITVDSEPGQGTMFIIYLPAAEETQAVSLENVMLPPAAAQGKVMIMDDEEMVRKIVQEMLSHSGYEVIAAKDGDEALQLYQEAQESGEPVDLIIMDLTIPGAMGGKEAVKEIHKINPTAKVIVSSGYSNDPVVANFGKYGFCGAMVKPFQMQELAEIVGKAVSS